MRVHERASCGRLVKMLLIIIKVQSKEIENVVTIMTTGRFFLDTEYTNGNYYMGDIFEITIISEDTCRVFHKYIKIPYRLSNNVMNICSNVTNKTLQQKAVPFSYMLKMMLKFIHSETTTPTLIAHGGFLWDFPLLMINCMKYNVDVVMIFTQYSFIDSMKMLQENGYYKPGLETISRVTSQHNALEDTKVLLKVFTKQSPFSEILNEYKKVYSLKDILHFVKTKLPVSITRIYKLVSSCRCHQELLTILNQYVQERTALNKKQVVKIVNYCYKYLR